MSTYDSNTPYVVIDRYSDLEATSPPKQKISGPDRPALNPTNFYADAKPGKLGATALGRGWWMFVAMVALISALAVGAAVGGGLGATLASCALAKKVQTTVLNPIANQSYKLHCGIDFGTSPAEDASGKQVPVHDLLGIIQYDLGSCLEACSSINRFSNANGLNETQHCRAVTFRTRMHESLASQEANCWLKNGTPASIRTETDPNNFFVVSAALQE